MSGRASARSGSSISSIFGLKVPAFLWPGGGSFAPALLVPGEWMISARAAQATAAQDGAVQTTAAAPEAAAKIPNDQLDSLVAPIALYPDPLLARCWRLPPIRWKSSSSSSGWRRTRDLKDKALADAVKKQDWDPSIQAMAALPDVVKQLARKHQVDHGLGQRVPGAAGRRDGRGAAHAQEGQGAGEPENHRTAEGGDQGGGDQDGGRGRAGNPQVVYVPSYNPVVVYGPPVYPYPPIYYPPAGVLRRRAWRSRSASGVAMGAMLGRRLGLRLRLGTQRHRHQRQQQFQPEQTSTGQQRQPGRRQQQVAAQSAAPGGAPYSDRATANKYGGTARGDSMSNRQASAGSRTVEKSRRRAAGPRTSGNRGGAWIARGNRVPRTAAAAVTRGRKPGPYRQPR